MNLPKCYDCGKVATPDRPLFSQARRDKNVAVCLGCFGRYEERQRAKGKSR